MKPINKGELYDHLGGFLKSKGIELKEGAYAKRIQQGCALLSEVINVSHSGLQRAKRETARKLDRMRQAIHEKTAPKPPVSPAQSRSSSRAKARATKPSSRKPASRRAPRKTRRG